MKDAKRGKTGKKTRPPSGPVNETAQLLRANPRPLIDPTKRIIVLFSPKSACSSVAIWFFHQIGHATAAQDFRLWPHAYRLQVYYRSALYRRAYQSDLSKYSVIRIVRDPFERAVSSFRHVQRTGSSDRIIEKSLGRSDIATAGLSFSEFLDFLDTCDMTTCDLHYRIQRHPLEDRWRPHHVINVSTEDLFVRLNQVEADLALPVTDFDNLEWLHRIDQKHSHSEARLIPTDAYTHRFDRKAARSGTWPPYAAFLTSEARERIARLYAADIKAYGTVPIERRSRQPKPELVTSEQD